MSWQDQAQDDLVIITGDGREFRPLWVKPEREDEFNTSQFNFPGIKGRFVSRGTSKGLKIPLEIYFSGENHLDESEAFRISSFDSRHWVVTHPYYGTFNAEPIVIHYDDSLGNVTKINITLLETIVDDNPKGTVDPKDKITYDVVQLGNTIEESFAVEVKPDTANINVQAKGITTVYEEGKKKVPTTINAEKYFNLFNDAQQAILNATDYPLKAMQTALAVIHYPFQFVDSIKNRINLLLSQFNLLRTTVSTLTRSSDKKVYEKYNGYVVATMARASVTELDYANASEVLSVREIIMQAYDDYVSDLDEIKTDNGGEPDSYIPNHGDMMELQAIVDYTVSNLIIIALSSKQERSLILEADSNVILLAHRFYGLKEDDSTVKYFMQTNNIGLNDLLEIKKGRKIYYYV